MESMINRKILTMLLKHCRDMMTHLQHECNSNTLQQVLGGKNGDWGSPVIPQVRRGFILHWAPIDNCDMYSLVIRKQFILNEETNSETLNMKWNISWTGFKGRKKQTNKKNNNKAFEMRNNMSIFHSKHLVYFTLSGAKFGLCLLSGIQRN